MSLAFALVMVLAAADPDPSPFERLDAAARAGRETLAILSEEVQLDDKDATGDEWVVPKFSRVWILTRRGNQVEIAVGRLGDVVQTGWVPKRIVYQGEAALELVGDRVVHDPKDTRARLAMAYLLAHSREARKMLNVVPKAAGLCDDVLRINPDCLEARVLLAELLNRLHAHDKAIVEMSKALSQEEDPWLYYGRGVYHANGGHHAEAVTDFERALAKAPEGWRYRRRVQLELKKARTKLKDQDYAEEQGQPGGKD